jgi:hypothetical protein
MLLGNIALRGVLDQPERHFAFFGDHILVPGRILGDLG